MLLNSLLLQAGEAAPLTGGLGMFLPLILIIGIMYIFMIRPQNKKQKELQKMLDSLEKGDKVITIGGIHGSISSVKKESNTVVVKVDDNTKIEFNRTAIATVVNQKTPNKTEDKKEKKSLLSKKQKEEVVESEEKKDE